MERTQQHTAADTTAGAPPTPNHSGGLVLKRRVGDPIFGTTILTLESGERIFIRLDPCAGAWMVKQTISAPQSVHIVRAELALEEQVTA